MQYNGRGREVWDDRGKHRNQPSYRGGATCHREAPAPSSSHRTGSKRIEAPCNSHSGSMSWRRENYHAPSGSQGSRSGRDHQPPFSSHNAAYERPSHSSPPRTEWPKVSFEARMVRKRRRASEIISADNSREYESHRKPGFERRRVMSPSHQNNFHNHDSRNQYYKSTMPPESNGSLRRVRESKPPFHKPCSDKVTRERRDRTIASASIASVHKAGNKSDSPNSATRTGPGVLDQPQRTSRKSSTVKHSSIIQDPVPIAGRTKGTFKFVQKKREIDLGQRKKPVDPANKTLDVQRPDFGSPGSQSAESFADAAEPSSHMMPDTSQSPTHRSRCEQSLGALHRPAKQAGLKHRLSDAILRDPPERLVKFNKTGSTAGSFECNSDHRQQAEPETYVLDDSSCGGSIDEVLPNNAPPTILVHGQTAGTVLAGQHAMNRALKSATLQDMSACNSAGSMFTGDPAMKTGLSFSTKRKTMKRLRRLSKHDNPPCRRDSDERDSTMNESIVPYCQTNVTGVSHSIKYCGTNTKEQSNEHTFAQPPDEEVMGPDFEKIHNGASQREELINRHHDFPDTSEKIDDIAMIPGEDRLSGANVSGPDNQVSGHSRKTVEKDIIVSRVSPVGHEEEVKHRHLRCGPASTPPTRKNDALFDASGTFVSDCDVHPLNAIVDAYRKLYLSASSRDKKELIVANVIVELDECKTQFRTLRDNVYLPMDHSQKVEVLHRMLEGACGHYLNPNEIDIRLDEDGYLIDQRRETLLGASVAARKMAFSTARDDCVKMAIVAEVMEELSECGSRFIVEHGNQWTSAKPELITTLLLRYFEMPDKRSEMLGSEPRNLSTDLDVGSIFSDDSDSCSSERLVFSEELGAGLEKKAYMVAEKSEQSLLFSRIVNSETKFASLQHDLLCAGSCEKRSRSGEVHAPCCIPEDPLFMSDEVLSPVKMELLWLGEESMFALHKPEFQFNYIYFYATEQLRRRIRTLEPTSSEKTKISNIIKTNDWLTLNKFNEAREDVRRMLHRGFRRQTTAGAIAQIRLASRTGKPLPSFPLPPEARAPPMYRAKVHNF